MKIFVLLCVLIPAFNANGQDSLQLSRDKGKLYGIFPLVDAKVAYVDSIVFKDKPARDSFNYKVLAFFTAEQDAKYYFQSEDKESGEIIYQGKLKKSFFSAKSDVHFTMDLHYSESGCFIKLAEVVIASSKPRNTKGMIIGFDGQLIAGHSGINNNIDKAIDLENIPFDEDEFSARYCEKLDQRLSELVQDIKSAIY
jgi:hypothetical protein